MDFPQILLIIVAVIAVAVIAYLNTPTGKGWLGEFRVKLIIGSTVPSERYVINDFKVRLDNGKTTQIDHILINHNGVFVIETKNYSGRIYGNENDHEWTQVLAGGNVKNKLYNPVKQNNSHMYHVSNILNEDVPVISVVVLVQGNTHFINSSKVCNLGDLKRRISFPGCYLNDEKMESLYRVLVDANDKTITRREHVQNINDMRNEVDSNICPRCHKPLVLRRGRNGEFYGCSGYPECRFTKNL